MSPDDRPADAGHDAASVVHQMAQPQPPTDLWTPQRLIDTFCSEALRSSFRAAEQRPHSKWFAGFCSYMGKNSYGPGVDGFDDGYCLMGALEESGWRAIPEAGSWPYSQYLVWQARESDPRWALAHYCEGDFGVEVFASRTACVQAVKELR
jgi:hypothetical protein